MIENAQRNVWGGGVGGVRIIYGMKWVCCLLPFHGHTRFAEGREFARLADLSNFINGQIFNRNAVMVLANQNKNKRTTVPRHSSRLMTLPAKVEMVIQQAIVVVVVCGASIKHENSPG